MVVLLENETVDDKDIALGIPNLLQNNLFFSKITHHGNSLMLQPNECYTSSGIKQTNHKSFCDLFV